MGECNAYKFSRAVLLVFNFILIAFGLATLGIGIYAKVHSTKFDDYLAVVNQSNSTWENFGNLAIAAGVICTLLAVNGCFATVKQHKGCMVLFVVLVGLIFLLEVIGASLAYGFEGKIKSKARDGMFTTLMNYQNDSTSGTSLSWDNIQQDLSCCGVNAPKDWWLNEDIQNGTYPASCYCKAASCNMTDTPFPVGCYDTVVKDITNNWREWGGALIAFAVLQLIGVIAGIIFIRKSKNQGYYLA